MLLSSTVIALLIEVVCQDIIFVKVNEINVGLKITSTQQIVANMMIWSDAP